LVVIPLILFDKQPCEIEVSVSNEVLRRQFSNAIFRKCHRRINLDDFTICTWI